MTEPFRVDARAGRRQAVSESDRLTIEKERVVAADYSGRRLAALWSVGSRFEGCSFERIRVEDAHFGSGNVVSEYVECRFDGSVLRAPTVGTARFVRCSFREVQLKDWSSAADIIDCVFSGRAKSCVFRGFAEDPLTGERLREAEFRGNDFSGMHFVDVVFRGGIDLREQRLPSGELDLYLEDARSALDRAQQWLAAWSDHDRREDAVLDLDLLRREVEVHGQEQLYVNVGDLERDPVTQRALLDALRS